MPQLDDLFVVLSVKDNRFTATMKRGADSVDVLQKGLISLNKVARKTGQTSRQSAKGVNEFQQSMLSSEITAAAFAFTLQRVLSNALDAFVEFEQGIIDVTKVINQFGQDEIPRLQQSIIDLTQSLPLARSEILAIGRSLGQLGFFASTAREDINAAFEGITELVGQVSVATDLSSEQAAQSFGVLRNVFLASAKDAEVVTNTLRRYADVANEISNTTAATATDVVRFNAAIGATATQLGLTFQQVTGFGAAVRQLGITTDVGATALQRFFGLAITRAEVFADAIGISAEQFREAFERDPNDALLRFFKALNEASAERRAQILAGISAEQRLVRVLNGIASNLDLVTSAQQRATDAFNTGGSVLEEFNRVNDSTQANLIRFGNTLSNTLLQGFENVAPVVNAFLKSINLLATEFPTLAAAAGTFVIVAGAITATLLTASILVPRLAQGYQLLTTYLGSASIGMRKFGTETLVASQAAEIAAARNARLAASMKLIVGLNQTAGRSAIGAGRKFLSFGTSVGFLGGAFAALAIGVGVVASITANLKRLGEQLDELNEATPEQQIKGFNNLARSIGSVENSLVGVINLITTGEFKTLSEELQEAATDIGEAQNTIDRFFNRAVSAGNADNATAAQIARAKLVQEAYEELGNKTEALAAVNVGSEAAVKRLREEFGASEDQLYALARAADAAGAEVNNVAGEDYLSNTQRVTDVLQAIRREQQDIAKEENLTLALTEAVTEATKERDRASKGVLDTLKGITIEGAIQLANAQERRDQSFNLRLSVESREAELRSLVANAVRRVQNIANEAGKPVVIEANLDTADLTFDITKLTGETQAETAKIIKAIRTWLAELSEIGDEYERARAIINNTETAQERLIRTSQEAVEDNVIALRRDQAQRRNNFEELKRIERESTVLTLQRLQREQDAAEDTVANERAYQARRTIILRNYAARRLELVQEETESRKAANEELQRIIDATPRNVVTDDLSEQRRRLQELREINDRIVDSAADEEVKRRAIKTVLEEISRISQFGIDRELEIRKELIDLEEERAEEVRKRIREEQVAAENVANEVRRTVNLNTRAGRQAVEAAEVERDLKKEIAELEADGIVTASEIDQIEQRRLEAAQRIAELTGQTRQAAGRDQLQDDLERIRDEARAQRAALEDVDGLDEQAIVDNDAERLLGRQTELQGELNDLLSTRAQLNKDVRTSLEEEIRLQGELKDIILEVLTAERARDQFRRAQVTGEGFDYDTATGVFPDRLNAALDAGADTLLEPEDAVRQVEDTNTDIGTIDVNLDNIFAGLNNIEAAVEQVNTAFDASAGSVNVAAQGVQTAASNFEQTLSPTLRNMTNALEATRGAFQNITDTVEDLDERIHVIEQIFNRAGD